MSELEKAGCDGTFLDSFLILLKGLDISGVQESFYPKGMTPRILDNLPSRIERMAEEIECVNEHTLFDPQRRLPRSGWPHPLIHRDFRILPGLLKRYGEYIEARTQAIKKFRQGPGRGRPARKYLICLLLEHLKTTTGKPHYEDVAELLSIALPTDEPYSADQLRKLSATKRGLEKRQAGAGKGAMRVIDAILGSKV